MTHVIEPFDVNHLCLDFYGLTAEDGVPIKVHKLAMGVVPIDSDGTMPPHPTAMHCILATTDLRGLKRACAYLSKRDGCTYRIVRLAMALAGVLPSDDDPPRSPSPHEGDEPARPNSPVARFRPRNRRLAGR
jgi:hypothetical protein